MKRNRITIFAVFAVALTVFFSATAAAKAKWEWVTASGGNVPEGAVVGGEESSGQKLYICRGHYRDGTHPGKIVGANCNFGWGGKEISLPNYEVLVGTAGRWMAASGGNVPEGAIAGGVEATGQKLIICRGRHEGGIHPGKIVGPNCNIGWGGKEILLRGYDVLLGSKALRVATVDGRSNCLDAAKALTIELPAGKVRITKTLGWMVYGKGLTQSFAIPIRIHDHASARSELFVLNCIKKDDDACSHTVKLEKGGTLQAFIVDDSFDDNFGGYTIRVNDKEYMIEPSHALRADNAVKLRLKKGEIDVAAHDGIQYGHNFPPVPKCFARIQYDTGGQVIYEVVGPADVNPAWGDEDVTVWLFVVDGNPSDNSGRLNLEFTPD